MKIMLLNNYRKEHTQIMTEKIVGLLEKQNVKTIIDDGHEPYKPCKEKDIDFIIVLGGDGTFLRAVSQYGKTGVPMLGVNMGTVGFYSNTNVEHIEDSVNKLLSGQYHLLEKMLLQAEVIRANELIHTLHGINEVVIKSKTGKMSSLSFSAGGNKIGRIRGDGVIIATAAGSTAYNYSAGGPIVDTDLSVFIVTWLAPYYPHYCPLVIEAGKVLEFEIERGGENILCSDGRLLIELKEHDLLVVRKAEADLKLIGFNRNSSFWSGVYSRLGRNPPV